MMSEVSGHDMTAMKAMILAAAASELDEQMKMMIAAAAARPNEDATIATTAGRHDEKKIMVNATVAVRATEATNATAAAARATGATNVTAAAMCATTASNATAQKAQETVQDLQVTYIDRTGDSPAVLRRCEAAIAKNQKMSDVSGNSTE